MSFSFKALWDNAFGSAGSSTKVQAVDPWPDPPLPSPRPEPEPQQPTCIGKGIVESLKREPGKWKVSERHIDSFRSLLACLFFDSDGGLVLVAEGHNEVYMGKETPLPGASYIYSLRCLRTVLNEADKVLIARHLEENPPAGTPLEVAIKKAAATKQDLAHFTALGCPISSPGPGGGNSTPINQY